MERLIVQVQPAGQKFTERPESAAYLVEGGVQLAGVQFQYGPELAGLARHPGLGQVVPDLNPNFTNQPYALPSPRPSL